MDKLHYGDTLWDQDVAKGVQADGLQEDIQTEVLIVGGGMSGNLAAYVLSAEGYAVTVVDAAQVGRGSSLANTGLLQYWSDTMLWELQEQIGERDATLFYAMCLDAMADLTTISQDLGKDTGYVVSQSVYYASHGSDVAKLEREYEALTRVGLPVGKLSQAELLARYGIDKPLALITWQDATVNPYAFIQALGKRNRGRGVIYHEHTPIDLDSAGPHTIRTQSGRTITFEHLIYATGYAHLYPLIEDKVEIHRTFAMASQPLEHLPWDEDVMFWETKEPYLYFRMTPDRRVVVGGLDEEVATVETKQARLHAQAVKLRDAYNRLVQGSESELDYE